MLPRFIEFERLLLRPRMMEPSKVAVRASNDRMVTQREPKLARLAEIAIDLPFVVPKLARRRQLPLLPIPTLGRKLTVPAMFATWQLRRDVAMENVGPIKRLELLEDVLRNWDAGQDTAEVPMPFPNDFANDTELVTITEG